MTPATPERGTDDLLAEADENHQQRRSISDIALGECECGESDWPCPSREARLADALRASEAELEDERAALRIRGHLTTLASKEAARAEAAEDRVAELEGALREIVDGTLPESSDVEASRYWMQQTAFRALDQQGDS